LLPTICGVSVVGTNATHVGVCSSPLTDGREYARPWFGLERHRNTSRWAIKPLCFGRGVRKWGAKGTVQSHRECLIAWPLLPAAHWVGGSGSPRAAGPRPRRVVGCQWDPPCHRQGPPLPVDRVPRSRWDCRIFVFEMGTSDPYLGWYWAFMQLRIDTALSAHGSVRRVSGPRLRRGPVQLRPIHLGLRRRRRPRRRAAAAAHPSRRCCPCSRRRAGVHQARQANCNMHSSWLLHDSIRSASCKPAHWQRALVQRGRAQQSSKTASDEQHHGSKPRAAHTRKHACEQSRAGRMRRATARMPPPQRSQSVFAASWRMCQSSQKKEW
jgi:hypothetical protein